MKTAINKKDLTFENVLSILTKHDLEGLIRQGAPLDEYASEARLIYRSLADLNYHPDFQYVKELIEYVFWTAFEVVIPNEENPKDSEGVILRDFYTWVEVADLKTMAMTLEICELMDVGLEEVSPNG